MRFIIILIFILSSANYALAQEKFPQGDFFELESAGKTTITQIISPDTIGTSDGRILHLTGLDFPDLRIGEPGQLAQTAQRILNDMLLGQDVRLYRTKNKETGRINRMGHQIVQIERVPDGAWLQGTLLSLGLARVDTSKSNPEMASQMLILEMDARQAGRGLWNTPDYAVFTPENLNEGTFNKFQIIEGNVQSASMNKNRVYLNFGKDWKTDFTVTIPPEDKPNFIKRGIDPLSWNGKKLRVRGWLTFYNGPNLEIDHPERVEVLERAQ